MFLLHHKKNGSNHMFSKQLKNLQSNQLIVGFIPIIYSSFACDLRAEGPKAPEARPERAEAARPERAEAARPERFCPTRPERFCPTRPERAEAPSPGQRPGYNSNQQGAL